MLELKETPKSCMSCRLKQFDSHSDDCDYWCYELKSGHGKVNEYIDTRHPDCPLKITEDNLRWQGNGSETIGYYITCPECKQEPPGNWDREDFNDDDFPNYCPHCGIKLLPPETKTNGG